MATIKRINFEVGKTYYGQSNMNVRIRKPVPNIKCLSLSHDGKSGVFCLSKDDGTWEDGHARHIRFSTVRQKMKLVAVVEIQDGFFKNFYYADNQAKEG